MNESPLAPVIAGAAGPELGNRLMYEYVARHGPRLELPDTAAEWQTRAVELRSRYLELYLHGHPPDLLAEPPRVVWGDTLEPSPEYRIRKLRLEGYPGVWVPALLYEPSTPLGGERSTPAVLDVNGHESRGIAVEHKQARCSNLARRGLPALSLELLGRGEMTNLAPHNHQQLLDLLGQAGAGVFYLTMKRALDLLIDHELTDPARVAMTGLSGGGWQTIVLSALDERVAVSVPVAGHMPAADRRDPADVGDAEQLPAGMCTIGDYDVLSALVAPRPVLFIFNRYDDCCFQPHKAAAGTYEAARGAYELLGVADRCALHVGTDPGHNYDLGNRLACYAWVDRHFGLDLPEGELPYRDQLYHERDLWVGLPEQRATFATLATDRLQELRRREADQPRTPTADDLDRVIGYRDGSVTAATTQASWVWVRDELGVRVEEITLQVDGYWPLPARLAVPDGAAGSIVSIGALPSGAAGDPESCARAAGRAFLHVDLIGAGLLAASQTYALLLRAIGRPALGLQVGQLAAAAAWARDRFGGPVQVQAAGRVASMVALLAAARDPGAYACVTTDGLPYSLDDLIESHVDPNGSEYPLFCFGMREILDIPDLIELAGELPITDRRHGPLTVSAL